MSSIEKITKNIMAEDASGLNLKFFGRSLVELLPTPNVGLSRASFLTHFQIP